MVAYNKFLDLDIFVVVWIDFAFLKKLIKMKWNDKKVQVKNITCFQISSCLILSIISSYASGPKKSKIVQILESQTHCLTFVSKGRNQHFLKFFQIEHTRKGACCGFQKTLIWGNRSILLNSSWLYNPKITENCFQKHTLITFGMLKSLQTNWYVRIKTVNKHNFFIIWTGGF